MKPLFIDNRDGNTLTSAIREVLDADQVAGTLLDELCIASAYFNPQGLELIAERLTGIPRIRLLLGAEPVPEATRRRRDPFDPREPELTRRRISSVLERMDRGLKEDRDRIPFSPQGESAIRTLLDFLRSGQIEVRRYERQFLHAKAFIFRGSQRGLLSGSSNLTRGGLQSNLELNLGHYEDSLLDEVEDWYEQLWEKASPFDLAAIYEELLADYPPYMIYLKVLWQLYYDELAEEEQEVGHIPVTSFQKHGVWRAKKILEKYGGVLIADGVGLGKTFTAGEIMREYRDHRQRVLLICPAALRDTSWKKFLNDYQLLVECLSYEQLARDAQLDGERAHLKNPLEDYALVVIDEAHNYRNPDAPTRAAVLRRLLSGKRRDLVMLTATPVNNSLWDLYHLLRYFMKQDARLADVGVLSLRDRFHQAMEEDPFDLSPDLLYPVIDATTVKRTRRFVNRHYPKELIKGPDGTMMPIRFPKPIASSIGYNLENVLPGFLTRLEEILMPAVGQPLLTMARYQPGHYIRGSSVTAPDNAIVGLLRSALLKRFESSVYAFSRTLKKMAREHEAFLDALERGSVVRKEFFKELSAAEGDDEIEEILEASEYVEDASLYQTDLLRDAVQSDLRLLQELIDQSDSVRPEEDPKLVALIKELVAIADQAEHDATSDEDERQKRKVLVFSHYEDTIDWIEEYLWDRIQEDSRLACFRDCMASASGREARSGIRREHAMFGFAPVSTGALPPNDEDRFDLLLSTDVLAEGLNLQQCRNIINYDLPWNPMRLVQRHGRIDRIGSHHREVYVRTFFPDAQLDVLLNLEERVRRKLAQAAASVGVEDAPIERGAAGEQVFTETREEIERLHREDATIYEEGGTKGAAQTGEEYRQELRKALERYGDKIQRLPWRIGSGMATGERTGHLFCASIGDRIYLRFIPRDDPQEVVVEIGTCLRLLECTEETPREISPDLLETSYDAWERARDSIYQAWMYETDPANLQPRISRLNREVAEHVRAYPPHGIEADRLQRCLDAIESPWSRREENQLRVVWKVESEDPFTKSTQLVEEVERIGAEPFEPPEPLPPIEPEEINLICWMGLTTDRA